MPLILMQDDDGDVWEVDASGRPIRMVGKPSSGGTIIRKPEPAPKPEDPPSGYRWSANGGLEPIPGGPADKSGTQSPQQSAAAKALSDDEVLKAIELARSQVSGWSTGIAGQALGRFGGTDARALAAPLSTIASRLTLDKLQELKNASSTGASGFGSLTEKEGALLRDSVAGLDQYQDGDALIRALDAVETHYRNMRALADGKDFRNPDVQLQYGIGQRQRDMAAKVTSALAPPGSKQQDVAVPPDLQKEIMGYVQSRGPQGLDPQDFGSFLNNAFQRYNYPAQVTPEEVQSKVEAIRSGSPFSGLSPAKMPLEGLQGTLNTLGQSAAGAYALNAADALTGGNLDSMTADPAQTRGGMSAVADAHPIAAPVGQFSGMILASLGAGRLLGGGTRAALAGDTLYGGLYGAGSNDQDRLTGALMGAGGGFVGSKIGNKIGDALTGAMRGVTNEDVQLLAQRGIPMTYGQMRGGAVKAAEERSMSNPFIGDAIRARQTDSLQGLNRAAFDEAGQQLGTQIPDIGQQGIAQAQQGVGNLYDTAHSGMQFVPDPAFAQTMGNIQRTQAGNGILKPEQLAQVAKNVQSNVGGRMRGGGLFGKSFKKAMSQMRSDAASMDPAVGSAVKEYRNAILQSARNQSDPAAVAALDRADMAYPYVKVLEQAVASARNQGDNLFTGAQLGNAAFGQTKKFGGMAAAARGDVPFNELQQAAVNVLPNRIPNSGTAERTLSNSIMGNLLPRAQAAVKAPLYNPEIQPLIQKLLLERPELLRTLGQNKAVRGLLGGNIGAPLMLSYQNP